MFVITYVQIRSIKDVWKLKNISSFIDIKEPLYINPTKHMTMKPGQPGAINYWIM